MAPIFFSETADAPGDVQGGQPTEASTFAAAGGATTQDDRFVLAGGNALLPTGGAGVGAIVPLAAIVPTQVVPGLILASLGSVTVGATLFTARPDAGIAIDAGNVSVRAAVDPAAAGGIATSLTSATAVVAGPVVAQLSGVVASITPVVRPLGDTVTTAIAAIATPLIAPVTTVVAPVTAPVTTAVAAITTPVAGPLTAPTTALASVPAAAAAPLAATVGALPAAGQPLAASPALLAADTHSGAIATGPLNGVIAAVIRNCLLGGCR